MGLGTHGSSRLNRRRQEPHGTRRTWLERHSGRWGMRRLVSGLMLVLCPAALDAQEVDWSAYGRDAQGTCYSPASQISRKKINGLQVAWSYRTGETDTRFKT